jgi:metallo-beta-lactamase class B
MKRFILSFLPTVIFYTSLLAQENSKGMVISHLTDNFYVYVTYRMVSDQPFPSNSMYLVTDKGVVMFDTPWDTTQFQPLLDSIEHRHHQHVIMCISTHFHADRTAGLAFLKSKGIATYSSKLTYDLCKKRNEQQAQYFFSDDTMFKIGDYSFETFYAGPGHTADNLVLWFGKYKILYCGCLVKSTENKGLGNIDDANITAWPNTIKKVMKKFPHPKYVIPGHFAWGGEEELVYTLKLLQEYKK